MGDRLCGGPGWLRGLDELAVEVAFVPHDLLHVVSGRQHAPGRGLSDHFKLLCIVFDPTNSYAVADCRRKVVGDVIKGMGGYLGLESWDTFEAPSEQGDALGEKALEAAFGPEAGNDPRAEALPVVERLHFGDNRSVRAEAMLEGVAAGGRLALIGLRSATLPSHSKERRQIYKRGQ